jgi:hypothetical protein
LGQEVTGCSTNSEANGSYDGPRTAAAASFLTQPPSAFATGRATRLPIMATRISGTQLPLIALDQCYCLSGIHGTSPPQQIRPGLLAECSSRFIEPSVDQCTLEG